MAIKRHLVVDNRYGAAAWCVIMFNMNILPITNKGESWHAPLNKVTSVSKVLAAIIFITLPILGFFLGMQYASVIPENAALAISAFGL